MRLEVSELAHSFDGEHFLFENLDFTFEPGRVYALVGPSGSGKSTLLSLIAGWVKPTRGNITSEGIQKTNWVFQNPHGVSKRTTLDHVVLPLLALGYNRQDAEAIALEQLGKLNLEYAANRLFSELSGGEGQRLMLARALAGKPNLLLVDEPTAQLDLRTGQQIADALTNVAQENTIVIIATHDEKIRNVATDVLDLGEYALIETSTPDELDEDEGISVRQPQEGSTDTSAEVAQGKHSNIDDLFAKWEKEWEERNEKFGN